MPVAEARVRYRLDHRGRADIPARGAQEATFDPELHGSARDSRASGGWHDSRCPCRWRRASLTRQEAHNAGWSRCPPASRPCKGTRGPVAATRSASVCVQGRRAGRSSRRHRGKGQPMNDADDTYAEFSDAVNMTAKQIEGWLQTEESKEVGQKKDGGESTGHEMGGRIVTFARQEEGRPDRGRLCSHAQGGRLRQAALRPAAGRRRHRHAVAVLADELGPRPGEVRRAGASLRRL